MSIPKRTALAPSWLNLEDTSKRQSYFCFPHFPACQWDSLGVYGKSAGCGHQDPRKAEEISPEQKEAGLCRQSLQTAAFQQKKSLGQYQILLVMGTARLDINKICSESIQKIILWVTRPRVRSILVSSPRHGCKYHKNSTWCEWRHQREGENQQLF